MKVLVCKNKHCREKESNELLKELQELNVESTHSSCMDFCESGPNVFTFPDLKVYGNVTVDRMKEIINHQADDLQYSDEELYNKEMCEEYLHDPMHRRTVKLFRWHLDKHTELSPAHLREIISTFKKKYDVKGMRFEYPVKFSLIRTIKGPDLPKLISYLGKTRTMELFDEFLKKAK